jgi:hexokinase
MLDASGHDLRERKRSMKRTLSAAIAAAFLAVAPHALAEVIIKGKNEQDVKVRGAVINTAVGPLSTARQSLASNVGKVQIGQDNKQTVDIKGAVINTAVGPLSTSEQALSSNVSK